MLYQSVVRNASKSSRILPSLRAFHSTPLLLHQYFDADKKTFQAAIQAKDRITLVDFYADWCGPCRQLSPILTKLTGEEAIKTSSGLPVDLVTVNTEDADGLELGQQYQVRALPTVIAFRDGKKVGEFIGALSEPRTRAFIDDL
ncbi:hypothetical protein AX16_008775 [Volvariella volvacea WC 439]|nr:hypothetical protein AX16_008775 [Volvariella volvacea WC 439]